MVCLITLTPPLKGIDGFPGPTGPAGPNGAPVSCLAYPHSPPPPPPSIWYHPSISPHWHIPTVTHLTVTLPQGDVGQPGPAGSVGNAGAQGPVGAPGKRGMPGTPGAAVSAGGAWKLECCN